jgi:hypothetical protein
MTTDVATITATPDEARVIALVREISNRYAHNARLPEAEQIPYVVFDHLVSLLHQQLEGYASESLLASLRELPDEAVVTKPLIDLQIALLVDRYDSVLSDGSRPHLPGPAAEN